MNINYSFKLNYLGVPVHASNETVYKIKNTILSIHNFLGTRDALRRAPVFCVRHSKQRVPDAVLLLGGWVPSGIVVVGFKLGGHARHVRGECQHPGSAVQCYLQRQSLRMLCKASIG